MDWLTTARELAALSQTGLHFATTPYDTERYRRLGAIAAEMLAHGSGVPAGTIAGWEAAEFGYATPKVDVRAVVFRGDEVLLVRENLDGGRWTLPGGWADVNETPAEAVVRELREESGYEARAVRLLAVLDRDRQGHTPPYPFHIYKLFFLCELTGGRPTPNAESSEQRFFPVAALPELSVGRVRSPQIVRFAAKVAADDRTTDFD